MTDRLPNFLVIGAMKAGTSSLWMYLREHPDVYLAPAKELDFFNRPENYARGSEWYRLQFAGAKGKAALGEASPSYMWSEDAPARMAALVPEARLIALLRNPVDRAYSHYWHERFYSRERRSFADAIEEELTAGGKPFFYLDRGRYLVQLQRICAHFPRSSLLVLLNEDLQDAPEATFALVCRFIGVDEDVRPANLGRVINPYREHRADRLWRLMFRRRLWRWFGPLAPALARSFVREGKSYPPMDAGLRTELTRHFAEDNEALGAWLARDLSAWQRLEAPQRANRGEPCGT